jgi:hypothetical protein
MFAAFLLSLCLSAHADVPPENTEGCSDKVAGDACTNDAGKKGACVKSTCSKLDYSNGTPPSSVDYECLLCDASAAPDNGCSSTGHSAGLVGLLLALPLLRRRRG